MKYWTIIKWYKALYIPRKAVALRWANYVAVQICYFQFFKKTLVLLKHIIYFNYLDFSAAHLFFLQDLRLEEFHLNAYKERWLNWNILHLLLILLLNDLNVRPWYEDYFIIQNLWRHYIFIISLHHFLQSNFLSWTLPLL